ncbi:hypothetical protein BKA83DRAFT_4227858 [Pisolithus microcarpus]|nr:hypothetical protein BKA83DRAFT_4227858 [Pisolithus microcarpus]
MCVQHPWFRGICCLCIFAIHTIFLAPFPSCPPCICNLVKSLQVSIFCRPLSFPHDSVATAFNKLLVSIPGCKPTTVLTNRKHELF